MAARGFTRNARGEGYDLKHVAFIGMSAPCFIFLF